MVVLLELGDALLLVADTGLDDLALDGGGLRITALSVFLSRVNATHDVLNTFTREAQMLSVSNLKLLFPLLTIFKL